MKIIIVGGGFAGVKLALSLAHDIKFQVTLVDKNSYNFFPQFLYQVASAFFEPFQISNPFLELFSGKENLSFQKGVLKSIRPTENQIVLDTETLDYDYLVLATGTETDYSGISNIEQNSFSLKTIDEAMALRERLLQQSKKASDTEEPQEIKKIMTFVVAGGGTSGVEIASLLAEIKRDINKKPARKFSDVACEIYLVQKDSVLLPAMSEKSGQHVSNFLQASGVKILLDTYVQDYLDDKVMLSSGAIIHTENLIWTAGIKGKKIHGLDDEVYGKGDRIRVDPYNKVFGTYNIFAIGDNCLETSSSEYPEGHPQVAQVAIQQGENLARNFQLMAEQKALQKFIYKDPGISVVTGRMRAVTSWNLLNIELTGKRAWATNFLFHWYPMMGHGNRLKIFFYGIRSYLFKQQSF
ncbi:FAD-dependent oxidoreductase [Dyadobacter sp. CY345]|uniref:NAD(P)/FAD-dependent oxidoreductase n=1 Tax=Dyadobacter sp. CY345 TaxID=2909335 RepID=UPI001F373D85|nr:FAD-dependent oxidoreductase [Dyadobacter sp. CY345]MCF2443739.1 FAD-dependent oxidoreductase [Dyadobacter sp. CY345]